jgi:hypothetical protein
VPEVPAISPPWYESATFWTGAGTFVAFVTLVLTAAVWYAGPSRKLVLYGLRSDTALLSTGGMLMNDHPPDLQVTLDGQVLRDPHFVSIVVANRSRRDIRRADFEDSVPLTIDVGAQIHKVIRSDTGGTSMPEIQLGVSGQCVTIGPGLIQRRQVISLDLLTDGPAELDCTNPSLADVRIRDGTNDDAEPTWLRTLAAVAAVIVVTAVLLQDVTGGSASKSSSPLVSALLMAGGLVLLAPTVAYLVVMATRQGGMSRARPWAKPQPGTRGYQRLSRELHAAQNRATGDRWDADGDREAADS